MVAITVVTIMRVMMTVRMKVTTTAMMIVTMIGEDDSEEGAPVQQHEMELGEMPNPLAASEPEA